MGITLCCVFMTYHELSNYWKDFKETGKKAEVQSSTNGLRKGLLPLGSDLYYQSVSIFDQKHNVSWLQQCSQLWMFLWQFYDGSMELSGANSISFHCLESAHSEPDNKLKSLSPRLQHKKTGMRTNGRHINYIWFISYQASLHLEWLDLNSLHRFIQKLLLFILGRLCSWL